MGQTSSKKSRNSHGDTDREALQEGGWISDHIMDVYYTYLENEVLSKSQYRKHHIYLVRATMAYYIRHQNEVESLALTLPGNLNNVRYIFFPINDNDDPSGHGGSHWSLLVVNVPIGLGFHYDSLGDRNDQVAKLTLGKISALLSTNFRYYRQPCPQQANISDCGIHVLYNTRVLISRMLYPNLRPNQPWDLSNLNPDTAKNRRELRDLYERIIHSSDDSNVEPESG